MGWVNLISCLLPDPAVVRLETWGTEHAPPTITLTLTPALVRHRARSAAGGPGGPTAGTSAPWPTCPGARARRCRPSPRTETLLRQREVQAPHLHRTPARRRSALGTQDGAAVRAADGHRCRAWRSGRRTSWPQHEPGREPEHPAAAGPAGALAAGHHADDAGRG